MQILNRHKKFLHEITSVVLILAVIAGTFSFSFSPKEAYAATFTFTQSDWSGGVTANTANHTSNQTGWTEYSSSTAGMWVTSNLQLATTSFSFTDDGATSTNGAATGGGFLGGTTSTAVVTGTSTVGSSVVLTKDSTSSLIPKILDPTGSVGQYTSVYIVDINTIFVSYYSPTGGDLKFAKSTNGGASWATSTVDTTGVTGQETSIYASDANTIFISYHDVTNADLKFAKSTNGGSSWTLSTIDSTGSVGSFSSIYGSDANNLFISYYDGTNADLKFAKSTNGGSSWTLSTIDSVGGRQTSIKAVDANTIFISYSELINNNLRFAKSTNGGTNWATSTISGSMGTGYGNNSLDAIDSNTLFVIYDNGNQGRDLIMVTSTDGGANWTTSNVDTATTVSSYKSLYAADANNLFISYYDSTNADLKFAKSTNGGSSWTLSTIDSTGSVGDYSYINGISANNLFISYYDNTNADLKFATYPYNTSGTFESATIDLANRSTFGAFSWNATTTAGTTLQFQVAANNTGSGWSYVGTDGTSGTYFTTSGTEVPSSLYNNRYFRYKAYFSTTVTSSTPILNDVSIVYPQIASPSSLISSAYDAGDSTSLVSKISWTETGTSTTETAQFQVRSSPDGSSWSNWCGPNLCDNNDYFDSNDNGVSFNVSSSTHILMNGGNDRWFQYKVILSSGGALSATIDNIIVTYVVNAPPDFDSTFGTNGASSTQVSTNGDTNWGKVLMEYRARDIDTVSGVTPLSASTTFAYRLSSSDSWTAVSTANLTPSSESRAIAETYTSTSTVWDAKSQIGQVYSTTTQIRITVYDREAANNTASTTSAQFTLDTKNPVATTTFDSSAGTTTGNVLNYNLSDNTNISYRLSNNSNFSNDGNSLYDWQSVGATSLNTSSTWTMPTNSNGNAEVVYYNVRDVYGNSVGTSTIVVPGIDSNISTGIIIKDVSNVNTSQWSEFISWVSYTATSGAAFASYKLYRSTNGSDYSLLTTITDSAVNYYRDQSLSSSTTYYYKVKFVDTDGDISEFSSAVSDQPDGSGGTDITAPTISSVTSSEVQSTTAKITWSADEMSDSKVVFGTTSGSYPSSTTVSTWIGASGTHTVYLTGLTPNTTYYYKVSSQDILGNGATSTESNFTTLTGPTISSVSCSNSTDNAATIIWNTNTTTTSSYVDYSTNSSLSSYSTQTTSESTFTESSSPYQHKVELSGLNQGSTYYFRVGSVNVNGTTADNNSGNFYTCKTTTDAKPPVISNITTPVKSDTSIVITWETDEPASTQVFYDTSSKSSVSGYANSTTEVTSPLTRTHIASLTGLTKETAYYFRVRSRDMNPDSGYGISNEQTATTTEEGRTIYVYIVTSGGGAGGDTKSDTAAPSITDLKISNVGSFNASVSFNTSENTTAFVEYGESELDRSVGSSEFKMNHDVRLTGLKMGTDYSLKVKAIDKSGNSALSEKQTFSTKYFAESVNELITLEKASSFQDAVENAIESILPSVVPPFIEKPEVINITENSATVRWKTNISSYSAVVYSADKEYDSTKTNPYSGEASNIEKRTVNHEVELTGLNSNTLYHYMAKSFILPQAVGRSKDLTFNTKAASIKPRIVDVDNDAARVVWTTDEPTNSIVEYKNLKTGEINKKIKEGKVMDHDIKIENLIPDSTYEITVSGYNNNNNLAESTEILTVKTSRDVIAPVVTNLKIDGALVPGRNDRVQTVVSWRTDEPASSIVEYSEGSGGSNDELGNKIGESDVYVESHNVILTKLKPGTLYRLMVTSIDDAGNKTISPVRTIITPRQSESIVDVIVKNFEETFQFLKKMQ